MPGVTRVSIPNRLLGEVPRKDYPKLLPFLTPVKLAFAEVLYHPNAPIKHVYFPNDCLISMLTSVDGDRVSEVGLVGCEGMIGIPAVLGATVSPFRAVVVQSGTAMRMKIADFNREFSKSAALQRVLLLFTNLLMIQIAQTAACNRYHVVVQRMARWLLMTRDRLNSNEFRMTQEFLGVMLGVRRSRVSLAGSALNASKLIGYRRGTVTILDQRGLEAASCGCYKTVKDKYALEQA